ncbi:hypothetical protein Fot_36330 [Forsythia ovata]|uniref:Uncharacterized protein n=1 Tax=Forsythia ovata TaxID=205694 RepID=A0ABD1SP44_9LAMI
MSSSSNDSPKTQNIFKETSEKVAQNCRLKKMKEPIVAEPRDELKGYDEKLNKIMMDIRLRKDQIISQQIKNKIMMDIRLRQDQIISQQIDLKDELRAMQLSVDEKINGFIDELRRKLTRNSLLMFIQAQLSSTLIQLR